MSKLQERKTKLLLETGAVYRARPLVVEILPYGVRIREKGRRTGYDVHWVSVFDLGAKQEAQRRLAARLEARKG